MNAKTNTNIYKEAYLIAKAQHDSIVAILPSDDIDTSPVWADYSDSLDTLIAAKEALLEWAFSKVMAEIDTTGHKAEIELVWSKRHNPRIKSQLIDMAMRLEA